MADPEARVVVTARDATAAAFSSADKHLKGFARSAMQVRTILAGFGVALSGRALAQWMSRAIETTDAVGDQLVAVQEAQKAFDSYRKASDALAESFAVRATPAVIALADAFGRFQRSVDPSDLDIYNARIATTKSEIQALQAELDKRIANQDKTFLWVFSANGPFSEQAVASLRARIAALKMDLAVFDAGAPRSGGQDSSLDTFIAQIQFEEKLREASAKRFDQEQQELIALETFIYELNQKPPIITQEELIALESFVHDLNEVGSTLTQEEWIDLESFVYDLNHMESEAAQTAKMIGASFEDSFSDWLVGADRSFKDLLKRMAADLATSALFKSLASLFPGGSFFANFFGGARAEGGPVSSGKGYLVGERGPELFFPGQSGMVAANGGGSSFTIHNNVTVNGGADPRATEAAVARAMQAQEKQTMSKIQDLMRRGRF